MTACALNYGSTCVCPGLRELLAAQPNPTATTATPATAHDERTS